MGEEFQPHTSIKNLTEHIGQFSIEGAERAACEQVCTNAPCVNPMVYMHPSNAELKRTYLPTQL